jgi:hypothetical protein
MVAREDIQPGTMVTEDMVEVRAVPEAILPADHLVDVSQAIGRVAVVPISADGVRGYALWTISQVLFERFKRRSHYSPGVHSENCCLGLSLEIFVA